MLVYRGSGVAVYTYNLIKNLLEIDKKNEYRLFYSSFRRPRNFYYLDNLKKLGAKIYDWRLPPKIINFIWNKHHLLPVEWLIGKVDIFHSSDFLRPPLLKNTKAITTIHDLTWKIFPEYHTEDIVRSHERKLQKTIKYGDIIIVDSQNTKKDLLKYYPYIQKTNRIEVIYPGVDERFKVIRDQKKIIDVLKKYHVLSTTNHQQLTTIPNFLLYVGALEPRKNLITAVKIYNELVKDKNYSDFKFLIVGRAGWKNQELFQLINQLKQKDNIQFVGFVEDCDLPYFYNAAKVFVYLSLYEGFGFPPLEAYKCHTLSLIYKNSSLSEILPNNYPYTACGQELSTLKKVIKNPPKIEPEYLSKFNWQTYCRKFLELCEVFKFN